MKDPARTWNGTVVLRIMEKQRTADRLALCEQMDLEARVRTTQWLRRLPTELIDPQDQGRLDL